MVAEYGGLNMVAEYGGLNMVVSTAEYANSCNIDEVPGESCLLIILYCSLLLY